jgi:hypothetical protein
MHIERYLHNKINDLFCVFSSLTQLNLISKFTKTVKKMTNDNNKHKTTITNLI